MGSTSVPRIENGVRTQVLADAYFNPQGNPPQILADYGTLDGVLKPVLDDTGDDTGVVGGLNRQAANIRYTGFSQQVHDLLF
jgi:hypothetical protein